MGGQFWESGGGGAEIHWCPEAKPQPPEARGLGAKPTAAKGMTVWERSPPTLENFAFFFQK